MKNWTDEELKLLDINMYKGVSYCVSLLNRSEKAVKMKIFKLNQTKRFNWTNKMNNFLLKMNGILTDEEIQLCLSITREQLHIQKIKNHLVVGHKWTPEEEQFLIENYSEKGKLYCIYYLKLTQSQITAKAQKLGLTLNNNSKRKRPTKNKKFSKYNVNPLVFRCVSTKEAAYLLGFIWGDGSIETSKRNKRITVTCAKDDILNIKNAFDQTGKWNFYNKPASTKYGRNTKDAIIVKTHNRLLVDYLTTMGYDGKSGGCPSKIISTIPDHLKHYWFRGLLDADGNWFFKKYIHGTYKNVSISSTYDQDWNFLYDLYNKLDIKFSHRKNTSRKGHKHSAVKVSTGKGILNLFNFIYPTNECDIGLDRKFQKALTIKKFIEK